MDLLRNVLADNNYPGRGVLWCTTGDDTMLGAYFLTGRSPASQARTLQRTSAGELIVAPSDAREHDHLRHYVAARQSSNWLVFGNGEQVSTVADRLASGQAPLLSLDGLEYEPDPPIFTPRYVFRGPARGPLASGPGMTVPPCRRHDLGGGVTG
ncbi:IMP cyclohydrolase, partial [Streptomyces phaeochromogenes]|uniref:IMP cyclohydrolase n=1 Tax=Streptomyces phaeochromogenes TaxID=1923 RepID=UPI0033F033BA